MSECTIDFAALAAPFPVNDVSWRVGSTTKDKAKGMALAYIDARNVMHRLDEVVGPCGWKDEYHLNGNTTICTISLKCGDEWVGKTDGAGASDVEPEKGALSDAFKRAAVKWGIGRYLYDLDSPWVTLRDGKYIADDQYAKLRVVLERHGKPQQPQQTNGHASEEQLALVKTWLAKLNKPEAAAAKWASGNRVETAKDLTSTEAAKLITMLSKPA